MRSSAAGADGRARIAIVLAAVVLCSLAPPAAARRHGHEVAGAGDAAALRRGETRMLGATHAAEHAEARASERAMLRAGGGRAGAATRAAAGDGPAAEAGRWNRERGPIAMPVVGINAVLLPTGRVMMWGRPSPDPAVAKAGSAWLWDPASGLTKRIDPPEVRHPDGHLGPAEIWCSGQSVLADGSVLVTGGNLADATATSGWKGLSTVFVFDPFSETWAAQPAMRHGRWYPSQLLMGDGRTLIMSGLDETGVEPTNSNTDVELFTPAATTAAQGTVSVIGGRGATGQPPDGGLYPHLFWMRGGHALVAGPQTKDSWTLRPGSGAGPMTWQDAPNLSRERLYGSAVLLPGGPDGATRVMEIGGIVDPAPATPDTEVFDEATSSWSAGPAQHVGRAHANTVLLPDGSMVTVGGGIGHTTTGLYEATPEHKQVELYDPRSATWRLGAAQQERRAYHSTALLLPDARVLSAGDDAVEAGVRDSGPSLDDAEIYEPPYLFAGDGSLAARPQISLAPASVPWGTRFAIHTTSDVARAVLVAPGAVTHANDMNQRHVELSIAERYPGAGVNAVSPPSADVAPPGYYMLFLIDGRGVPSVARFVRLGSGPVPEVLSPAATTASSVAEHSPPAAATSPPPAPPPPPAPTAPPLAAVAGLRVSPGTFRAASSGATVRAAAGSTAAQVSYTLNVAARVRFTVERSSRGRRAGGRCVAATASNRRRTSCTLFVPAGASFTRSRPAGGDRFAFSGRVAGRTLTPGPYRLVATPTADGRSGGPASAAFRIRAAGRKPVRRG
ncbi:MAG: hypothetical protein QOJ63_659 [Solirubrobacteraceae bacterium]|nr:hypothetical protein [Solirubrobacteraceae bacterium]